MAGLGADAGAPRKGGRIRNASSPKPIRAVEQEITREQRFGNSRSNRFAVAHKSRANVTPRSHLSEEQDPLSVSVSSRFLLFPMEYFRPSPRSTDIPVHGQHDRLVCDSLPGFSARPSGRAVGPNRYAGLPAGRRTHVILRWIGSATCSCQLTSV